MTIHLTPSLSWHSIIRKANSLAGYERFRFNVFIYERTRDTPIYSVLWSAREISKEQFIDYVMSDGSEEYEND